MSEITKIAGLLKDDAIEKRIAAAIVLGELKAKAPEVMDGLASLLESNLPALQRHALDALAKNGGAKKVLPKLFPLLTTKDGDVRRAAMSAIASIGDDALPKIRERMASAEPDERHALDGVLALLGGKEAFTTLLAGMASAEGEAARQAALAVRTRVKDADGAERRSYLAETEKFLKQQGKAKAAANVNAIAAGVKILGYIADERALPTLLEYARDTKAPSAIRQEAIIGMRFALGEDGGAGKERGKVVAALLDAAADPDRALAQTALHTLGSLELTAENAKRLEKLVTHPELDRARFVIEQLGRQKGADAARVLVQVMEGPDKKRAEIAAQALGGNDHATPLLGKALLGMQDADRSWMVRNVLRPTAKKLAPAMRKQLLEEAMDRFQAGARNWEALLDVARDADPDASADALRAVAQKLRKAGNKDKAGAALSILCKSDRATDDDRYARASLDLLKSGRDTRPAARAGDESLRQLDALVSRGYDVAKALRTDKGLELDHLFYVGFHFAEEGHPLGEDLLNEVVKKGGRNKLARMAKNKLALSDQSDAASD